MSNNNAIRLSLRWAPEDRNLTARLGLIGFMITVLYAAPGANAQGQRPLQPTPGRQQLHDQLLPAMSSAPLAGDVSPATELHLAMSLPLRNEEKLDKLLKDIYNPASPEYQHFLTPEEFTEKYGPTPTDYQAVVDFAKSNGLTVTAVYANRLLVNVSGAVSDIQKAFHTTLRNRKRADDSIFYAPDREPSLDLDVPVLHVSGLDNYVLPHPTVRAVPLDQPESGRANPRPAAGSDSTGLYGGPDFRTAYVPGTTLTGAGQCVGLYQADGFYLSDIVSYENHFKLPNVPVQPMPLDGLNGTPSGNPGTALEVPLDIEMAIAMAPGLSRVVVYEGKYADTILTAMASPPFCQQLSVSYVFDADSGTPSILKTMAAQGQSLFAASGDSGAYPGVNPPDFRYQPWLTVVGATELSMNGKGASWQAETGASFSGGGVASVPIPDYQQRIWLPGGSYQFRNLPDVSMVGDGVIVYDNNGGTTAVFGTSISSPLWAGFMALVNQQRAANGMGALGFANPALYSFAAGANYDGGYHTGTNYGNDFHDIVVGNNQQPGDPNAYYALQGYDLVTGWGSPTSHLITDLSTPLPPSQFPGCQRVFTCPNAVSGPPTFTVQCSFQTDFYAQSPTGSSSRFLGTDTQVVGTSSNYDVTIRACYPGSNLCTGFEVGTSPQQWCQASGGGGGGGGCGTKGCGKCPGGICQ